jgi:hypothetical protein
MMWNRRLLFALVALLATAFLAQTSHAQDNPKVKQKRMKKLMAIIKKEPAIKDVQKWAVKHYRLETGRINGMSTKARVKGLIPEIEASFDNMVGNNFTNTRDGLFPILPDPPENRNPDNYKERVQGSNDSRTWRVRAVWQLDRLLFNAEALDAKSLTSLQENLIREVTTVFYARRRILANMVVAPPQDQMEYFYELQRLEEMTATLDAFTGGRFSDRSWQWDDPGWAKKVSFKKRRGGPKLPGLAGLQD